MKHILKPAAIMGIGSAFTMIIGIIKTKFIAVMLGPEGIALMGQIKYLFFFMTEFASIGLGGAVQWFAESIGKKDYRLTQIYWVSIFIISIVSSLLISIFVVILKDFIAWKVFDNYSMGLSVLFIALILPLSIFGIIMLRLLNGFRAISSMARSNFYGAFISLPISIVFIVMLGKYGIVFGVLSMSLLIPFFAYYELKKYPKIISFNLNLIRKSFSSKVSKELLLFGLFFGMSRIFSLLGDIGLTSFLIHSQGIEISGMFQASLQVSGVWVAFVLTPMTTDYYPRLTQSIENYNETIKIINEQTYTALIIIAPFLILFYAYTKPLIIILFSPKFTETITILKFQIVGDLLKIVTWSLGFWLLSSGKKVIYFSLEVGTMCVFILGIVTLVNYSGIVITGIMSLFRNVVYAVIILILMKNKIGFLLEKRVKISLFIFISIMILMGSFQFVFSELLALMINSILVVLSFGYSIREINKSINIKNWIIKFIPVSLLRK